MVDQNTCGEGEGAEVEILTCSGGGAVEGDVASVSNHSSTEFISSFHMTHDWFSPLFVVVRDGIDSTDFFLHRLGCFNTAVCSSILQDFAALCPNTPLSASVESS